MKQTLSSTQLLARTRYAGREIGARCSEIHRCDGELGVKRILGVLSLARKHGAPTVNAACAAATDMGVPTCRFVRRYIERRIAPQLSLRPVDPLIRELTHYRDLINHMTKESDQISSSYNVRCGSCDECARAGARVSDRNR